MFTIDVTDGNMAYLLIVRGFSPEQAKDLERRIDHTVIEARAKLRYEGKPLPTQGPVVTVIALEDHQELMAYAAVPMDDLDTISFDIVNDGEEE